MTAYVPFKVNLTDSQKKSIANAVEAKTSIRLRLCAPQLLNGTDTLGLTKTQIARVEKRKAENKGIEITLSTRQVAKQGGFLGALLLNAAKSIMPKIGVSALEGLTSGLINKIISGDGCDYNAFAVKVLPHLLKRFPITEKNAIKEGGFVIPLLASLASSLVPTLINLISGKGYQVRPPVGLGYQVRPPKNYSITP